MENIETHDFDVAWKIVLETFFEDFLELFLNKFYCDIDWHNGYVSLEQELQKNTCWWRREEIKILIYWKARRNCTNI